MLDMKRTFLTLLTALLTACGAWAQNPFEYLFSDLKVLNTTSEQGHDRLDSLYYLHTQTYTLPYKGRKAAEKADGIVEHIVDLYNSLLPSHTGGFCHSSDLHGHDATESRKVSAYYGENLPPMIIGGEGINYALLRKQDAANPNYRTVHGVEWWTEHPQQRVCFKVFSLFGPMTDYYYRKAMFLDNSVFRHLADSTAGHVAASGIPEYLQMDNTEFTVQSLRLLCDMYKGEGNAIDDATAEIAAERFINYLESTGNSTEERIRVMREMRIPGFYAEVTDGVNVQHGTLPWLAEKWKDLNVFCLSWEQKGSPECKKYGDKSKYLLLQVVLQ